MARINLLPWREELRERKKKEFFVILGVAALIGAIVFMGGIYQVTTMQDNQLARNKMLNDEIKIFDEQIKEIDEIEVLKQQLIVKKETIEDLQANRSQIVKLFDQIVRTIPDGIRLTKIKQTGQQLTLSGIADSNAKVSAYMRLLDASELLDKADLTLTQKQGEGRRVEYEFSVKVTIQKNKSDAEQTEGVQA